MKTPMTVLRLCLGAGAMCLAVRDCDRAQGAPAQAPIQQTAPTNHPPVRLTATSGLEQVEARANRGDADAQYDLGGRYSKGDGVPLDEEKAVAWYRKAAEQGYTNAQCNLGDCYSGGRGVPQDYVEAVKWYRKAAEQGDSAAAYILALCYYDGHGVLQDSAEAAKWFRKAAEQNLAQAQYNLAVCYERATGVAQDQAEAVKWYRKAAEQGLAKAQAALGHCYMIGKGVAEDYNQAVLWSRKAAEQGDARGQNNLGVSFEQGPGVPQDYAEAVRWYRKAADQGFARAQCNLGICYALGLGVAQDDFEAANWYRNAAEQGGPRAQCNLGVCYEKGQGVAQDYGEAVKWYRKAAEQGGAVGQRNLGICYATGRGVPKDLDEAVKWLGKAAELGDDNAKEALARAESEKAAVAAREALAHSDVTRIEGASILRAGETVSKIYPDGLLIESLGRNGAGWTGVRKVSFEQLPESVQRSYGYDPQQAAEYVTKQARWRAGWRAEQVRKAVEFQARQEAVAREAKDRVRERIDILSQIVSDYHKSHSYSMEDWFVCADMACDVWNMVKTRGIEAKIQVGDVDRDITSLSEANHAWVLAETSPGECLALETTGGRVVYQWENPRYYWGWSFDNPKKFKEFNYGHR